jgi:hypothetical protein
VVATKKLQFSAAIFCRQSIRRGADGSAEFDLSIIPQPALL